MTQPRQSVIVQTLLTQDWLLGPILNPLAQTEQLYIPEASVTQVVHYGIAWLHWMHWLEFSFLTILVSHVLQIV